ncbi:hypothetical protein BD769DRAFT_1452627, partial [Suillus cothurnatus]
MAPSRIAIRILHHASTQQTFATRVFRHHLANWYLGRLVIPSRTLTFKSPLHLYFACIVFLPFFGVDSFVHPLHTKNTYNPILSFFRPIHVVSSVCTLLLSFVLNLPLPFYL